MREKSIIPELLREIVAKGESLNVEFKREEQAALLDSALLEAVVCLVNQFRVEPGRPSIHIFFLLLARHMFLSQLDVGRERLGIKKESRLQRNDGKVSRRMLERIRLRLRAESHLRCQNYRLEICRIYRDLRSPLPNWRFTRFSQIPNL